METEGATAVAVAEDAVGGVGPTSFATSRNANLDFVGFIVVSTFITFAFFLFLPVLSVQLERSRKKSCGVVELVETVSR